jgi:TetR/AcrR family fatty acid metabolism transcriptional regulator
MARIIKNVNPKAIHRTTNLSPEIDRRTQILVSAIMVFGKRGFQNAPISEIAKNARMADASIYEYFKGKEDLLLAIPVEVTKKIIPEIEEHMMGVRGAFNKLRKFVWWYLYFFEKNPEYGSIVLLELKTSKMYIATEAYQAARTFYKILLDIIKEGQQEGVIKKETNVFLARSLCVGAIEHITIRWLLKERSYSLIQFADELVDLLIRALKDEKSGDARPSIGSKRRIRKKTPALNR